MVLRYGAADLRASAHFGALCGRRARYGAAAAEAAGQAADIDEIHDERNAALIAAGGKHSRLLSPEEMSDYLATSAEQPTVTVDKRATLATVPAHRPEDDSQVYAGTLAHGIDQVVGEGACGVVVDLRGNTGGDTGPMLAGLSGLLPDGPALSFVDRHSEQPVMIEGAACAGEVAR
ncbi:S41 family peptidase [Corynebacterium sp. YIM 101645]|uniref:S41 family peptidase n=1 Tax=Corynebacterium lemuris TaxID=1859292 RepID=A0ABT2G036_9CORY|nr:S41 family peptidase [Corynebacterium lemuris]MCS5480868.1 S41 family peptidase [Corynebacterium lemuris]